MLGGTVALAAIWMTFAWAILFSSQFGDSEAPRTDTQQTSHEGGRTEVNLIHGGGQGVEETWTRFRVIRGLTARFEDVPREHAGDEFSFKLRFSEPITLTGEQLRTYGLRVLSGYATAVEQVGDRADLWSVTLAPDGKSSVRIGLVGEPRCRRPGAICTRHLIPLTNLPTATVPGPPVSVEFLGAPEHHSGLERIPVLLAFSEPILVSRGKPGDLGLKAEAGSIERVSRVDGRHDLWEVVLVPKTSDDLVLSLEPPSVCSAEHSGCLDLHRVAGSPVLRVPPATIHLTFDDGPDPFTTPLILDILALYNAKATFFVVGRSVASFPELIDRMVSEGHTLANHTWAHDDLLRLNEEEVVQTLLRTQAALGEHATPCFRPPNYRFNDNTVRQAAALGLRMILNTGITDDWRRPGADVIAANIVASAKPNVILVLHDGDGARGQTIEGLNSALNILSGQRYAFEPVCQ